MEKFLRAKGIETIRMVENGVDKFYAYNQDLLSHHILVEYYHADIGDDNEPESESAVWVRTYDDESSYNYFMFIQHGIVETAPLTMYRILVDLFDILAQCNKDSLMADLMPISRHVSGSDVWDDVKDKKKEYDTDRKKIDSIIAFIRRQENNP